MLTYNSTLCNFGFSQDFGFGLTLSQGMTFFFWVLLKDPRGSEDGCFDLQLLPFAILFLNSLGSEGVKRIYCALCFSSITMGHIWIIQLWSSYNNMCNIH